MLKTKTTKEWICDECGTVVISEELPKGWCRINEQEDMNMPYDSNSIRHLSSKQCLKKYIKREADEKEAKALKKYYA